MLASDAGGSRERIPAGARVPAEVAAVAGRGAHGHLDGVIVSAHTIGNPYHHGFYITDAKGCDR